MYGYVYLTTNEITGKQYIGKHKSQVFDPLYKGSGKYLIRAFKKYGWDIFTTILLKECETLEELNTCEIEYIAKFEAVTSDNFYNLARGGEGHTATFSEESKQKLSKSLTGRHLSEETKQKISQIKIGQKHIGYKKRKPFKHKKPMTEEHKRKIVESRRKNSDTWVSEETRKKLSESHKGQIPWNKGLKLK